MDLYRDLLNYQPYNKQEEKDKQFLLKCLKMEENVFTRDNVVCHFTASSWTINRDHTKILMAYHKIYDSFSWLGGHADGERDLLQVAVREVQEESGIRSVKPLSEDIFSIEVLTVDGHEKRGEYVSSHLHLNVTYLLEADDREPLKIKEDENSDVRWFPIDEAVQSSNEKWFKERIYNKLNEKLKILLEEGL